MSNTTTKKKKKRVQLQAKSDNDTRMTFTMSATSRSDLEFCQSFIEQGLNIEVSAAVLLRRALSAFRQHLNVVVIDSMCDLNNQKRAGDEDASQAVIQFTEKLDLEREELFHAAGRKEDIHKWKS